MAYSTHRNEEPLYTMIEHLRHELLKITEHKSFSDRDVVELSQRLDAYIILAQREKSERPAAGKREHPHTVSYESTGA